MASSNITQQIRQRIASNNVIETAAREFGSIGDGIRTQAKDAVKSTPKDSLDQLLGTERYAVKATQTSGEMSPGQSIDFSKTKATSEKPHEDKAEKKPARVAAAIEYHANIQRSSEQTLSKDTQEKKQLMRELVNELQRMAKSTKAVEQKFAAFTVEQAVVTPGKYHTNFLEWMLIVVRDARRKVEDTGAWLAAMGGKKGKKGHLISDSWKKGDTSVTMSNERQVATQSG
jgi:hypothetical protein